jgi:hypothetical protein
VIILIIAGLTLLALLLKLFGVVARLETVATTTILLVGAFTLLAGLLWQMQRDNRSSYDALEMLMDNGKASLEAHITIIMAGLALWWLVSQTQAGKDVGDKLVDILMIFVIYRGAKKAIDAYSKRPVEQQPDMEIGQQVIVTPDTPAVPAARQVRPVKAAKMSVAKPTKTASGKPIVKGEE